MHIVVIAWLYVTLTMALTMRSFAAGIAFFVGLGLAPVVLWALLAMRRVRARREREGRDARKD